MITAAHFSSHLLRLRLRGARVLVAVSGGPDSVALLDLLVRSSPAVDLVLLVAHLDHGIHPDSARVAASVAELAARYDLPVEVGRLHLGADASETAARVARYRWLEATRRRVGADLIATAHHADDQHETVLMRVLRGSGPAGLAGMAARRGRLVRPLLPFRRAELAAHLEALGLAAWSDPANTDIRHLRSWLRTELLPAIRRQRPDIDTSLRRLGAQAARDRTAWDALLEQLAELDFRREVDGASMSAPFLAGVAPALAQALLAAVGRRIGAQLGPARLARVAALLKEGESGAATPLGGPWRAERSFDRVYYVKTEITAAAAAAASPWSLNGDSGEHRWGAWCFRWARDRAPARQARDGDIAWLSTAANPLTVRPWLPGDRIRPLAGAGQRPVAQCLQEHHVPRWRRAEWPALTVGETVVWVPGVCRSDAFVPEPGADARKIEVVRI